MAKIKLTKTELKAQSDALKRFQRFLPMLQLKKQQLQAEIAEIAAKADAVTAREQAARQALEPWVGLFATAPEVLDGLVEQHALAWNSEVNRALADPETGMAATLGKIMTTIARMCAGDKVPYSDEKKVMEYDDELYARVKQAQMTMAAMKKKQKE